MERPDFQLVLDKLDIAAADVYSYEENWPHNTVVLDNIPQVVKSNIRWCTITLHNGTKYHLKMNRLSKIIRTIDEPGYDLMEE